jgi:hypothetical protein
MGTRQGNYAINGEHCCFVGPTTAFRTCNLARNSIQAFPLLKLCSSNVKTPWLLFIGKWSIREFTLTVVYLSYDYNEPPPPRELWEVIAHCCRNNMQQLVVGCDANGHHTKSGTPDFNPKGHHLLECLVTTNVNTFKKR